MERYIINLDSPEPERPSQDLATQHGNAAVRQELYNASLLNHMYDFTPAGERHTIRPGLPQPEWFERTWPQLYMLDYYFAQLWDHRVPQPLPERVSPPPYVILPGSDGPVAFRITNTSLSQLRPPLPSDLQDWSDISFYDYMQYMPDILNWDPSPFITQERNWSTTQETADEAVAVESPPARFVESPPARFVETPFARFFVSPPARSVDSRLVNVPMWGHSSQMLVETPQHIPFLPPLVNLPTPARSVESRASRFVPPTTAGSVESRASRFVPPTTAGSVESRPSRFVPPTTAGSVESRASRFVPPTTAGSVESRAACFVEFQAARSVQPTPARSVESRAARSARSRPARSERTRVTTGPYQPRPAHMPLRPIPLVPTPVPSLLDSLLPPPVHPTLPLSGYASFPAPVHTQFPSLFFPPEAHSTHMPVHPPVPMPVFPQSYMPLNSLALMTLHLPAEVPDPSSLLDLTSSVRIPEGVPDLQN